MGTFSQEFLKIYDRKIASGEVTFSRSGITGGDFTAMCINRDYVIPMERLEIVFEKMGMSEEEREMLTRLAEAQEG